MADQTDIIKMDGGRKVAVHRLAEGPSGRTIVFCHPAPGSGNFDPGPEQTRARDVTLIAPDRPGYGQSDPVPAGEWPTIDLAARDVIKALEGYGDGPFGVVGWSGGGRVALAVAALRPDLVDRVVVIATPAPNEVVKWVPDEQQAGIDSMRGDSAAEARAKLLQMITAVAPHGDDWEPGLKLLGATPADEDVLARPGVKDRLRGMLTAAFAQGAVGASDDIATYTLQPWGFDPNDVKAKTLLLYGTADPVAGNRHGSWWQKQIPDARLEMVPNVGHMVVFPMWERALSHLAPGTKKRGA